MDKALGWFIGAWVALVALLNVLTIADIAMQAPDLWSALIHLQATYSPFNLWNWGGQILLLSPALLAYRWREKRRAARPPVPAVPTPRAP